MNFDDPRIKQLAHLVLCVMAFGMFVAASYCCAVAIEYLVLNESRGNDPDGVAKLMSFVPRLQESKVKEFTSLIAVLLAAVPLMVAPVCIETVKATAEDKEQRLLTQFGAGLMYALLLILLVAVVAYLAIDPAAWNEAQAHTLDLAQLTVLQDTAHNVIRGCVFFLAALLGLKAVR